VGTHPLVIEGANEAEEPFAIAQGRDALERAVGIDFVVWDWERDARAKSHGDRTTIVKISERLPDPLQVQTEDWFVLKRLNLDAFFFLNLAQPVRLFSGRTAAPPQEA
jgi:hypothetical protein